MTFIRPTEDVCKACEEGMKKDIAKTIRKKIEKLRKEKCYCKEGNGTFFNTLDNEWGICSVCFIAEKIKEMV